MNNMLRDIATGFVRSPGQITVFLLIVAAFIIFIVMLSRYLRKEEGQEYLDIMDETYQRYLKEFNLEPIEEQLITSLSRFLKDPRKKYLLFVNQHTFNACLSHLAQKQEIPPLPLFHLRNKLGFPQLPAQIIPASTRELQEGMSAILINKAKINTSVRISAILPNSLEVTSSVPSIPFRIGELINLIIHNFAGLFEIKTQVIAIEDLKIQLAHSEFVIKIQRRKYYRKKITVPIYIQKEGLDREMVKSVILDLSTGGMSLENTGGRYKKGDDLSLYLHKDGESSFHLYGEVVRLSHQNKVLHFKFGHLNAREQDRLVSIMNAGHL